MKNLKSIITIFALSITTFFYASEKEPIEKNKTIRTEISSYIGKNIPVKVKASTTAEISFIVNNKNEIVVLTIDSKITELNAYIKNKLNYKKVNTTGIKKGEIYKMPLKIKTK